MVWRNPVGARSFEGLGALGRFGMNVFYCSYIPTLFSSRLLTTWRAAERFSPSTSVFSSIIHRRVIFVFASFFPYSLPFNCCCVCN